MFFTKYILLIVLLVFLPLSILSEDIIYIIDKSGSMSEPYENNNQESRFQKIQKMVLDNISNRFSNKIEGNIGLILFDSTVREEFSVKTVKNIQEAKDALSVNPNGNTNIWDALYYALQTLTESSRLERISMWLLTDGLHNVQSEHTEKEVKEAYVHYFRSLLINKQVTLYHYIWSNPNKELETGLKQLENDLNDIKKQIIGSKGEFLITSKIKDPTKDIPVTILPQPFKLNYDYEVDKKVFSSKLFFKLAIPDYAIQSGLQAKIEIVPSVQNFPGAVLSIIENSYPIPLSKEIWADLSLNLHAVPMQELPKFLDKEFNFSLKITISSSKDFEFYYSPSSELTGQFMVTTKPMLFLEQPINGDIYVELKEKSISASKVVLKWNRSAIGKKIILKREYDNTRISMDLYTEKQQEIGNFFILDSSLSAQWSLNIGMHEGRFSENPISAFVRFIADGWQFPGEILKIAIVPIKGILAIKKQLPGELVLPVGIWKEWTKSIILLPNHRAYGERVSVDVQSSDGIQTDLLDENDTSVVNSIFFIPARQSSLKLKIKLNKPLTGSSHVKISFVSEAQGRLEIVENKQIILMITEQPFPIEIVKPSNAKILFQCKPGETASESILLSWPQNEQINKYKVRLSFSVPSGVNFAFKDNKTGFSYNNGSYFDLTTDGQKEFLLSITPEKKGNLYGGKVIFQGAGFTSQAVLNYDVAGELGIISLEYPHEPKRILMKPGKEEILYNAINIIPKNAERQQIKIAVKAIEGLSLKLMENNKEILPEETITLGSLKCILSLKVSYKKNIPYQYKNPPENYLIVQPLSPQQVSILQEMPSRIPYDFVPQEPTISLSYGTNLSGGTLVFTKFKRENIPMVLSWNEASAKQTIDFHKIDCPPFVQVKAFDKKDKPFFPYELGDELTKEFYLEVVASRAGHGGGFFQIKGKDKDFTIPVRFAIDHARIQMDIEDIPTAQPIEIGEWKALKCIIISPENQNALNAICLYEAEKKEGIKIAIFDDKGNSLADKMLHLSSEIGMKSKYFLAAKLDYSTLREKDLKTKIAFIVDKNWVEINEKEKSEISIELPLSVQKPYLSLKIKEKIPAHRISLKESHESILKIPWEMKMPWEMKNDKQTEEIKKIVEQFQEEKISLVIDEDILVKKYMQSVTFWDGHNETTIGNFLRDPRLRIVLKKEIEASTFNTEAFLLKFKIVTHSPIDLYSYPVSIKCELLPVVASTFLYFPLFLLAVVVSILYILKKKNNDIRLQNNTSYSENLKEESQNIFEENRPSIPFDE